MKKIIFSSLLILCIAVAGCKNQGKESSAQTEETTVAEPAAEVAAPAHTEEIAEVPAEEPVFVIATSKGNITVKLYKETPLHRDNFVKLAKEGYYNGILFHRIIKNFMIQTGDPNTKDMSKKDRFGTGGPGYTIPAEIVEGLHHKKGALAAARRGDSVNPEKASSGSQFYIVLNEEGCKHLDGEYTIFGEVVEGLDVVDKIGAVATDNRDFPTEAIAILSISEQKNK